jgi:lipid A 3-O-deacylase
MTRQGKWAGPLARLAIFSLADANGFSATPADATERGGIFSITDENDAWSNPFGPHQDRHYTHGIKLGYLAGDDSLTNITARLDRFFCWGHQPLPGNFGFVAGQDMFTPENILDPHPIMSDRPYAGWLYAGMVYQRRNEFSAHFATMENFEINFGIVGPDSIADDTQTLIHRWRFPEDIPQGWRNQIRDEPGLVLKYAHLWRYSLNDTTARFFDLVPRAGFELGNVAVFGTAGVTARLGFNLPPDFGMQIIDSPASVNGAMNKHTRLFACYVFAGADERYVLHNITLDGNTFRTSQSVEKYNFVNDLSWGVAVDAGRHLEFSWAQITRSKEFHTQQQKDVFGSINFKLKFAF